jgi:hypothetical protein
MKLLYRIPRECEDREGHLVFDYYCYPPADAITGRSFFLPCRGAAAKQGLEDLLRVVYELVKVTRHSPAVPTRPATPRQSRAQSRPPMTNSPRRQRSESSDDNLPKRRMNDVDRENQSQGEMNDAESIAEYDEDVTRYKFKVAVNDGSFLEMEGYQYPKDFFDV